MTPNDQSNVDKLNSDDHLLGDENDELTEANAPVDSVDEVESRRDPSVHDPDTDDGWLGGGLVTLLLVAGIVLFLFPEPATSALGIFLVIAGAVLWVIDWAA